MTTQAKIFIGIALLLLSFAFGRYSADTQPMVSTQTDIKATDLKQMEQVDHSQTIVVTTKEPSGEEKTVTTINTNVDTKVKDLDKVNETQVQVVAPPKHDLWTVSGLAGTDATKPLALTYGLQVTKQVLGPIAVGAFGLTNGIVGLSIGVSF